MKRKCEFCEDVIQYELMKLELPYGIIVHFCDDICFNDWLEEHLSLESVDEDD